MDEWSLEGFLDFTDEDLAANRSGALSPRQASSLRRSGIWRLIVGPVAVIVLVVAATQALPVYAIGTLLFLGLAGAGLYLTWQGFAFLTDGNEGTVAYVTGPMRTRAERTKYGMDYHASIGPVTKKIDAEAYTSLPAGVSCHLYYAPGSRSLLSVESATAADPKPPHPFGPDSAHTWNRVRLGWVIITIGVVGLLIAAHQVAIAHPAHTHQVSGTVSGYDESHGKSGTSRYLYLNGDSSPFSPQNPDTYDPPVQPFSNLIGRAVVLYVNDGTRDVLALNDGEQLHAAYWFEHPEAETQFEIGLGVILGGLAVITVLVGMVLLAVGRLRRSTAPQQETTGADPMRISPPTVRHPRTNVAAAFVALAVSLALLFALEIGMHR